MDISILSDMNNPVMDRREITFSVVQDGKTASREEIKVEICKRLNLSPDATIVTEIDQEFGVRRSSGSAHSYKSKEALEKAEPRYLLARLSKRAKKQEAPQEAKEEKKAEVPKEAKEEKKEHASKEPKEEKTEAAPKKHEKEEKKE